MRCWIHVLLSLVIFFSASDGQAKGLVRDELGDQRVVIGLLPCRDGRQTRERGLRQLAWEIQKRTSLEVSLDPVLVDPASPKLFETPLLVWSCEGPVAELEPAARQNLQRFLVLGGLVWIDDPSAKADGAFRRSVDELFRVMWPDKPLRPLSPKHVLFKSFFLIERQGGRKEVGPIEALMIGDRLAVILSPNDLLGALSRDLLGNEELTVEGGSLMREYALRSAVNLVMYGLCLDYKDDRVHLPFILKRRRL